MFVLRNEAGKVVGVFANLQPGKAEEYLQPDDAELSAFFESLKFKPSE
ncbi:hypothetical protein [Pseudomonas sp. GZD-209]